MKFSVAAIVAFAAAVIAKPVLTNSNYELHEDEPFTITWKEAEGPVTLTLKTGPSKALSTVITIASGEEGNSFTWTPTGLPSGTYAIEINDSTGVPNYSVQFEYVGTGALTSSSASVSRTSSAASSSTEESTSSSTETETETTTASSDSTTITSASSSITTTTKTAPKTTSADDAEKTSDIINSNNGQRFASSLALVLGTVAALVFFN